MEDTKVGKIRYLTLCSSTEKLSHQKSFFYLFVRKRILLLFQIFKDLVGVDNLPCACVLMKSPSQFLLLTRHTQRDNDFSLFSETFNCFHFSSHYQKEKYNVILSSTAQRTPTTNGVDYPISLSFSRVVVLILKFVWHIRHSTRSELKIIILNVNENEKEWKTRKMSVWDDEKENISLIFIIRHNCVFSHCFDEKVKCTREIFINSSSVLLSYSCFSQWDESTTSCTWSKDSGASEEDQSWSRWENKERERSTMCCHTIYIFRIFQIFQMLHCAFIYAAHAHMLQVHHVAISILKSRLPSFPNQNALFSVINSLIVVIRLLFWLKLRQLSMSSPRHRRMLSNDLSIEVE